MPSSVTAVPLGVYRTSGSRVRFPRRMTLLKLAMPPVLAELLGPGQLFRRLLHLRAKALVMLAVNFRIELELRTQFGDQLRVGVKNKIHVVTGLELAGHVGKLARVHFLD